jgi:tetratricopeptide (TPR) repeat protein
MCLGESTTALGGRYSYPRQLENVLNERNTGIKFSVINKGIAATDTTMIASLLEKNLDEYKPDLVLTMIGINDLCNTMSLEDAQSAKFQRFLKNIRVYKLALLLREHITLTLRDLFREPKPDKKSGPVEHRTKPEPSDHFDGKENWLRNMIRENPGEPEPHLELGDLLLEENRLEEAEALYLEVEGIAPGLIGDRYDELTRLHFDHGNFHQCLRVGEKAIRFKNGKNSLVVGDRLARAYLQIGKPDKAERICKMTLEWDPRNAPAWCYLGDAYHTKINWPEAERAYRKSVAIEPSNIAFTHLIFEYVKRKQFKKVEELGLKTISTQSNNPRLLGALAFCYQARASRIWRINIIIKSPSYRATHIKLKQFTVTSRSKKYLTNGGSSWSAFSIQ